MDILYRRRRATAGDILAECADSRSYSTVRTQLRVLEQKGRVKRLVTGGRYLYSPTVPSSVARGRAFRHLLKTFFGGSLENAIAFALKDKSLTLTDDAKARLITLCAITTIRPRSGSAGELLGHQPQ